MGDSYNQISPEGGSITINDSKVDEDAAAKAKHRVVVKINHKTEEKGAYPIVLVSYDIVCNAYKDAATARFAKSWLSYVTSKDGQAAAQGAAGTAPLPEKLMGRINKSIQSIQSIGK